MTGSSTSSARWRRTEELFHAALERAPGEREAFLSHSCAGDAELLAEVRLLLRSDGGRGTRDSFLEPPGTETLRALTDRVEDAVGPAAGMQVGPFSLVRRIASGGMGTVYEALRSGVDFEQRVAVKLIRPELATPEVLERFRAERRTLARLSHPNIARLLDGGTSAEGLPYLAMEYVDGRSITDYCDQEGLALGQRLELFRTVCAAVHYAHTSLVVHRDIKPGNILVDSGGTPKLLDFGIAKVFADESDAEAMTATGNRPMTPEYASPEQLRGLPLTTATDVYSLGIVLYELLTGTRPHRSPARLRHEVERAVLEEPTEKPSTVAARLAAAADTDPDTRAIFERRGVRPERLRRQLSGDLDTIVLMALRKEPERRYASVEQLGEDIRRHQRGLPVLARPDTWGYRTTRFLGRHRLGLAAAAVLCLSSLAAGWSLVWSARDAERRAGEVLRLMRLADLSSLSAYQDEVERLWPATPEQVPALEAWLARARELAANLERHRRTLAELRARALPWDEPSLARRRREHPRARELSELEVRRDSRLFWLEQETPEHELYAAELAEIDRAMGALQAEIDAEAGWRFAREEEALQHDVLSDLVVRLEAFVAGQSGTIARMEERLAFASSIERRSLGEHAAAWDEACRSIADPALSPAYRGLDLAPQLGLVPLGPDPDSGLWEFAHLQTGAIPERDPGGRLVLGEGTGLVLVLLPGGTATLGARRPRADEGLDEPHVDPLANPSEGPVHEVELAPFLLSKYEMTQGQWLRFTGENPSHFRPGDRHGRALHDLTHPVEMVSWEACDQVLRKLGLALPTEAQWEYAARAGTSTPWWTGSDPAELQDAANLMDLAAEEERVTWPTNTGDSIFDDGFAATAPVGRFRANAFGLCDVHGNVWEWTSDDFANYALPVRGPAAERLLKGSGKVVGRGGSFMDLPVSLRVAHRGSSAPSVRDRNIGVRPALAPRE